MPPKRKAKDAASPNPPAPSRARPRASKTSLAADGNDQDNEFLPSRPVKRPRKAPSRAVRPDDDQDDELGNFGRTSNPTTIEQYLMEQSRKSKEFIQSFKDQVAKGQERVHETLSKLKQGLDATPSPLSRKKDGDGLLPTTPTTPTTTANDDGHDEKDQEQEQEEDEAIYATLSAAAQVLTTDDNPLFAQTQQLLRLGRAILQCHRKAETESRGGGAGAGPSPRRVWERDAEGMRLLLACGREVGERVVEGWLNPSAAAAAAATDADADAGGVGEDGQDGEEDETEEVEGLAKGLFVVEGRRREEESWGVVAKRQMVALAGVVRALGTVDGSRSD